MRAWIVTAALIAVSTMARAGDASSSRGFRIFPTNSFAQCVVDGTALEAFPPIARVKAALDERTALPAQAMARSPLRDDIAFYAFALMPGGASADWGQTTEEDGDFRVALMLGFSTNVTLSALEKAIVSMAESARPDGGRAALERETLSGDVLKISVTNNAPETVGRDGGDLPGAMYISLADGRLAVVASEEGLARGVADDVRNGRAFQPEMPPGRPFFWLTATVNPMDVFGGDDDDDDEDPALLDAMPFLRDMSRISASARGVHDDESVAVAVSARFATAQSAARAAEMLEAMCRLASLAGDGGGPFASLAAKARVEAVGAECRATAKFQREDLQPLIDAATPH